MTLKRIIFGSLLLALSTAASAEIGGLLNGRSADLNKLPDTSVEAGADFGEFGGLDYRYFGVRYNYRVNPDLMAFADIGSMKISFSDFGFSGDVDGIGFGVGGYYMLHDLVETADTAVKFSFHSIGGDIKWNVISLEGLISGRNGLGGNPDLQWYGNFGINMVDGESEFLMGAGIVHPLESGEIFGGVDFIDDMHFGIGYRHFL